MLSRRAPSRGFSLIELIVVMAVMAMLTMMAAPSFSVWVANSRIRVTAESVLSGLQSAKSEAVTRNTRVRFQLTSTLDNSCVLSRTGVNWVINLDPNVDASEVESLCATPANPLASPANAADAPYILQTRPAAGSGSTAVAATESTLVFSGLGRIAPPLPAGNITIDISNPTAGTCFAVGGELTCLRIVITPAGQVRMCDPNPDLPAGDPRIC
jgi:type IV fimbrial biogenesis protein FimT